MQGWTIEVKAQLALPPPIHHHPGDKDVAMPENEIRVLLIEDNPLHARMLRGFLDGITTPRFPVEHEADLTAGLNRAEDRNFDVALLDLV